MALMTWLSGGLYTSLEGAVPLGTLQVSKLIPLLVLLVAMQLINDLMMYVELRIAAGGGTALSLPGQ